MKYKITKTSKFVKNVKIMKKRGFDLKLLNEVIKKLANGERLPARYEDHALKGKYIGFRECHINNDWLLIYRIKDDKLCLLLSRTGTHSDLF